MTRDEFIAKWRPVMLGWMGEAWALRKLAPSEFGMEMDRQIYQMGRILDSMYAELHPKPSAQPPANGPAKPGPIPQPPAGPAARKT